MVENIGGLAHQLETLCTRILAANGYQIISTSPAVDSGADILALEAGTSQEVAVQVKLYRSARVDRKVLRNAAVQIVHYKQAHSTKALLIVTTTLDESDLRLVRNIGVDEVWDISEISRRANIDSGLGAELERFFHDAELQYPSLPADEGLEPDVGAQSGIDQNGERLVERLQSTTAGNVDARRFEDSCCECIQYLFGEQFGQLNPQNRVEQGFQYMDLIARLSPRDTGAFWVSLAQDFRCRYVVFEFKNYSDKISQNQVYTTEKYLYPNALRSVAIIIARNGCDSGATRAVQGALRESGKVILVLSLGDLIKLLRAKDRGLEPSDLLIDHLDNLLTTIAP